MKQTSARRSYGRSYIYAVLATAGAVTFALVASNIHGDQVGAFESTVFRAVNDLPGFLAAPVWPFMQVGNLLVVPLGALAAGVLREFRLGAAFVLVGLAKYFTARLIKQDLVRHRPAVFLDDVNVRLGGAETGLGFASGHATIAVGVAVVLAPYLRSRAALAILWVATALVLAGRVYVGAHLPLDVVGGGATGLVIGSLINLALGTPQHGSIGRTASPPTAVTAPES